MTDINTINEDAADDIADEAMAAVDTTVETVTINEPDVEAELVAAMGPAPDPITGLDANDSERTPDQLEAYRVKFGGWTPEAAASAKASAAITQAKVDAETEESKRIFIMVTMPKELFDAIETDAKARSLGNATYARQLLADLYHIKLPETSTRKHTKYATPELKEAARKEAAKSRAELMKQLMKDFKAKQASQASLANVDAASLV